MYIAGTNRDLDTGDTYFQEISKLSISGSVEAKHKLERKQIKVIFDGKPLDARAEHGRWIVDCPNCNSAEFAFEDNLFFCSTCKNSDIKGQARKVKMPKNRKQIESLLGKRQIINRHWYPGETAEDLEKENTSKLEVI